MDDLATGVLAALVGGFAGFLTSVVSNLFERRRVIDESVRAARLEVYESLWHKFGYIPRWPAHAVTPAELQQLSVALRDWYFGASPETALAAPGDGGGGAQPGGMYLSHKSRARYNAFQTAIEGLTGSTGGQAADEPLLQASYDELQTKVSDLRAEITEDLLSRRRVFLTR